MTRSRTAIVIVGVGGQGSVFIARVLGEAALRSGLGVVASELHGMAQRGGVVESTVIVGAAHGPIVAPGEGDLLIALEPLEAVRALPRMRRGAAGVMGLDPIVPSSLALGGGEYPPIEALVDRARAHLGAVATLELSRLAREAGEERALGAVALGAAAGLEALPLAADLLRAVTVEMAPRAKREPNGSAFDLGLGRVRSAS